MAFLGKTTDTTTGLVDDGARKYDPTAGRFISADPVLETSDPNQIGGYGYAGNNPVDGSDPTGLTNWGSPSTDTVGGANSTTLETSPSGQAADAAATGTSYSPPASVAPAVATTQNTPLGPITIYTANGHVVAFSRVQHKDNWQQFWDGVGNDLFKGLGGSACAHAGDETPSDACMQGVTGAFVSAAFTHGTVRTPAPELMLNSPLAWEDATWGGRVQFGALDALGRPTGVAATVNKDMLTNGTEADSEILPPGFRGGAAGDARGHLLAAQLGGSGDLEENLVSLIQNPVNTPVMRGFENQVRKAVENNENVQYMITPIYKGSDLRPTAVTLNAYGDNGFQMDVSILNIP